MFAFDMVGHDIRIACITRDAYSVSRWQYNVIKWLLMSAEIQHIHLNVGLDLCYC